MSSITIKDSTSFKFDDNSSILLEVEVSDASKVKFNFLDYLGDDICSIIFDNESFNRFNKIITTFNKFKAVKQFTSMTSTSDVDVILNYPGTDESVIDSEGKLVITYNEYNGTISISIRDNGEMLLDVEDIYTSITCIVELLNRIQAVFNTL